MCTTFTLPTYHVFVMCALARSLYILSKRNSLLNEKIKKRGVNVGHTRDNSITQKRGSESVSSSHH